MQLKELLNLNESKEDINNIINHLNNGGSYSNDKTYQYVKKKDGKMFKWDMVKDKYIMYIDINKFAKDIFKSQNTGF